MPKAVKAIKKEGCDLITAEEVALARMQLGEESQLCTEGTFIKEGFLMIPGQDGIFNLERGNELYLLRNSLVVSANKTIKENITLEGDSAHILRNCFDHKKFLEQLNQNEYLQVKTEEIPTDRFEDEEMTLFLFGKHARDYGLFLKELGCNSFDHEWSDEIMIKDPTIYQAFLIGISGPSDPDDEGSRGAPIWGFDISEEDFVRGIIHENSEGIIELPEKYTVGQIRKIREVLRVQGINAGLEQKIIEELPRE